MATSRVSSVLSSLAGVWSQRCSVDAALISAAGIDSERLMDTLTCGRNDNDILALDLTGASPDCSMAALREADAIFIVGTSRKAALEMTRDKIELLRALNVVEKAGLLLTRVHDGVRPDLAEELLGVPVSGVVEQIPQIEQFARWLAHGLSAQPVPPMPTVSPEVFAPVFALPTPAPAYLAG
jgi:hypothetical protein